MGGGVSNREN